MLIVPLLASLLVSAPPKIPPAKMAAQQKLAADCAMEGIYFPPATILTFESPKAAYDRFEVADPKGEWQAPGTIRRTREELYFVGADATVVLASFDDVEMADRQEDSLDPKFHSMDVGERFVTLRFRVPPREVPPLPTDRAPTAAEVKAHEAASFDASFERWILALVDRRSGKILGARSFLPVAVTDGDKPGRVVVSEDRVTFLDDLDDGKTFSLADLERCALLEEDAAARAAGHFALARTAAKRASKVKAGAKPDLAAWREAMRHFDLGLGVRATDSNVRVERAAVYLELARNEVLFTAYTDAALEDLDLAAKYPEDLTPASKAQAKRLREAIARLGSEPARQP